MKTFNLFLINFLIFIICGILVELYFSINQSYLKKNLHLIPKSKLKNQIINSFCGYDNQQNRKDCFLKEKIYFNEIDKIYGATNKIYQDSNNYCNTKEEKKKIIIAVGDSFTTCLDIKPEETWVYNLNSKIKQEFIVNYGLSSTGPIDYYNEIKKNITSETKVILYGYYEGNDFRDMIKYSNNSNNKKYKNNSNNKQYKNNSKNKLFENKKKITINYKKIDEYLLSFNTYNIARLLLKKKLMQHENFNYTVNLNNTKIPFNLGNSDQDEIISARILIEDDRKNIYLKFLKENLRENFKKSYDLASVFESKIIFLYFPSAYSAFGFENTYFENKEIKKLLFKYSSIQQDMFQEICDELKLNCYNTIQDFLKFNENSNIPSHFPYNLHFTPSGSKYLGGKIFSNFSEIFNF